VEAIALLQLTGDGRRVSRLSFSYDCLVFKWIEFFADGIDGFEAMKIEDRSQLAIDDLDALHPGEAAQLGRQARHRTFQVIQDRQELAHEARFGHLDELRTLLLGPPPIVREVSLAALPRRELFVLLSLQHLK